MVTHWTSENAEKYIFRFNELDPLQKESLLVILNQTFPPEAYNRQKELLERALINNRNERVMLDNARQRFPVCIDEGEVSADPADLKGYGIVLTAGGEGERLRLSLLQRGISPDGLADFTKATFPIDGFPSGFGTLQINLTLISKVCKEINADIPVIVTTGPKRSATAEIIPEMLREQKGFGLKNISCIPQGERLHLTADRKIAYKISGGTISPVTNPDETGGPVMKLKHPMEDRGITGLKWFASLGCSRIILLQATALYETELLFKIASAGKNHDGLGIGIHRKLFSENDPYGSFVVIEKDGKKALRIIEQATRNRETLALRDAVTGNYLPFNTGFYVFDANLLERCNLPDYATPPKEVLPDIERAPKVGYAATDILSSATTPAVLTISEKSFGVIKNAEDLDTLSRLGKKFGLDEICRLAARNPHAS